MDRLKREGIEKSLVGGWHATCDRLRLAATPARRSVTMLVVRDA